MTPRKKPKGLFEADIAMRLNLKALFERKVWEEEIKWKQRSRCRWLKEGNKNTKFFHRLEDKDGITGHILNFFQSLYKKDGTSKPSLDNLHFRSISEGNANWLENEFQEEEVKATVFNLASDKAPGPDGFLCLSSIDSGTSFALTLWPS